MVSIWMKGRCCGGATLVSSLAVGSFCCGFCPTTKVASIHGPHPRSRMMRPIQSRTGRKKCSLTLPHHWLRELSSACSLRRVLLPVRLSVAVLTHTNVAILCASIAMRIGSPARAPRQRIAYALVQKPARRLCCRTADLPACPYFSLLPLHPVHSGTRYPLLCPVIGCLCYIQYLKRLQFRACKTRLQYA